MLLYYGILVSSYFQIVCLTVKVDFPSDFATNLLALCRFLNR